MPSNTSNSFQLQRTAGSYQGGLELPVASSASLPPILPPPPLAETLLLPLRYRDFARTPAVEPGDMVEAGQRLDVAEANSMEDASAQDGSIPPLLASTSGTVIAIENHHTMRAGSSPEPCLVLKPDGRHHTEDRWNSTANDWNALSQHEQLQLIEQAAIVGLGGAGFSSVHKIRCFCNHLDKLRSQHQIHDKLLILNAVECEPLIKCDAAMLEHETDRVLSGLSTLLSLCEPSRCVVALEEGNPFLEKLLQTALEKKFADSRHKIELLIVPAKYPSGAETQLIQLITGRKLLQSTKPARQGVLCLNVGTVHAIAELAISGCPLLTRVVTVHVQSDGQALGMVNVRTPFGTPASHLVRHVIAMLQPDDTDSAATELLSETKLSLTIGGQFSGYPLADISAPVGAGCNCVQVQQSTNSSLASSVDPLPSRPCIRCGDCSSVCPVNLLPQQLHWYASSANLSEARAFNLDACIECGCCDAVCPSHIPLTAQFREAKETLKTQLLEEKKAARAKKRYDSRQLRLEKQQRERDMRIQERKSSLAKNKAPGDAKPETKKVREDAKQAVAEALARSRIKKSRQQDSPGSGADDS